ncbi:hypothetical protein LSAT2_030543 [Lamellibrachia satsuma]|nr:hypothetical protein LSAT2_030543 [Lamellibrachia satsuma]
MCEDSTPPQFVDVYVREERGLQQHEPPADVLLRITLHVYDKESGIRAIRYLVNDVTLDKEVWNGTSKGQHPTHNTAHCEDDGSCVCTPFNGCYLREQVFYFDHCWLVNIDDHAIRVKATIYNHAGLSTTDNLKRQIEFPLRC